MTSSIEFFAEETPGHIWRAGALEYWPRLRSVLHNGPHSLPSVDEGWAGLAVHMPELLAVYEAVIGQLPDDEALHRTLPLWCPPPLFAGCSIACVGDETPMMLRNYDFEPANFEGRVWLSRLTGPTVLASVECLWGALDGINEHGLAAALTFGGSAQAGRGFGSPMIVRYLLETCHTVDDARAALVRLPSAWVANIALLDGAGIRLIAYLRPGRPAEFEEAGEVTNHQPGATPISLGYYENSVHRLAALRAKPLRPLDLLEAPFHDGPAPTLYSVAYSPTTGTAHFYWPGQAVTQSLTHFTATTVDLPAAGAAA